MLYVMIYNTVILNYSILIIFDYGEGSNGAMSATAASTASVTPQTKRLAEYCCNTVYDKQQTT